MTAVRRKINDNESAKEEINTAKEEIKTAYMHRGD